MAEVTQGFKFTAVGRIKEIRTELITSPESSMRGRAMTHLLLESDVANYNGEHAQLMVNAYGQRSADLNSFAVGDEVKVDGNIGSGRPRTGTDSLEHYRPGLSLAKIEKAEGIEHGFTFEAAGKLERVVAGQTFKRNDAKAAIVLTREYERNGAVETAKVEINAFRGAALDVANAQTGDMIVARGGVNSRPQVDFNTNQVRTDADGHPYYNTYVSANEVLNLTPHVEKTAEINQPEAESPAVPF